MQKEDLYMSTIEIKNVSFAYEAGGKLILEDIHAEIGKGEFVCILGQSGCGKSTLLRLLAGLETSTAGEILSDGMPIGKAGLDKGVVFQDYGLFPWMTAGENILLALEQKYRKRDRKELKEIVFDMLRAVGLNEGVYKKLPKELSGGMRQRCAIAQAFALDPPVLLMDEPFGALDAVSRARLQDLVRKMWRQDGQKKTIFFVTHDVDEALLLASRILVIGQSPGNIIYDVRIPEDQHTSRETFFENTTLMNLRMTLLYQINKDVAAHI